MASDTPSPFHVSVKTISGEKYLIEISPEETVEELKRRLEAVSGLPSSKIRLIFQGKALVDTQKLGADCKIQNENVVHMVEKLVPTEGTGGTQGANQSNSPSPAPSASPTAAGPFLFAGPVHPGAPQGPNVVIRAVQFGFDPSGATSPNSIPPAAILPNGTAQPSTTQANGQPSAHTGATGPQGQQQAYYQQMMGLSNQWMNAASQLFQPGTTPAQNGTQPGSAPQSTNGTNGTPNGPRTTPITGHVPIPTHAHIQVNLPQIMLNPQTLQALSQQWTPFEVNVLPQFENHIRTLANDITTVGESFHAPTSLPDRTYEIDVPRTLPQATNDPVTLHTLWRRVTSIQRRWLAIVDAIEGEYASFGTEATAQESRLANLPFPRIGARSTSETELPQLVLPLLHPLRHLLEHWAPQVTMQLSFALSNLYPLLSQHHNLTHHRNPAHPHPQGHAHPHTQQAPSVAAPSRASADTPPTASSASPQASPSPSTPLIDPTTLFQGNADQQASSSANPHANDFNSLFRNIQANFSGILQSFNRPNPSNQAPQANGVEGNQNSVQAAQAAPQAEALAQTTANSVTITSSMEKTETEAEEVETADLTSAVLSSPTVTISEPVASSSNESSQEDVMSTWDAVIARDVERQSEIQAQSPFSHAYAQETYQDSLISSNSTAPDRDLLEELIRTAEEAVPGSTTSGLPLANTALPPALLTSFQTRLERHIQARLQSDTDWAILQQRGQTANRFPNLHLLPTNRK